MASIIPGYKYDIFISYRQKDNKYDCWVTEFVDNLKKELEATFKEEISVYFDINPHDGLLETHDVNASLKDKLKCLVFIPIISRTYCDPKSFAWEHEFKAFIVQASMDQFGLKVKLPNGNVANRVLPIRIYDLDNEDIKLCESVTGGALRGVEFIYAETGVNRPLKPDDDEKINLNKTKYRNQINKVGNAIKEIISGLKTEPDKEKIQHKEPLEEVKNEESKGIQEKQFKLPKWKILIGSIFIAVIVIAGIITYPKIFKRESLELLRVKGKISVAVIPFLNMTNDTTWNVWQNGLQEILTNSLSNSEELRVCNTESVRSSIQGKDLTNYVLITPAFASAISQKLDADVFIFGKIIQVGRTLRLSAQLIEANTEEVLKPFQIEGDTENILPLADSLSRMLMNFLVLSKLNKELYPDWQSISNTNSPEAYRYYIDGVNASDKRDYQLSVKLLSRAVSIDSNFVTAGLFLAITYPKAGLRDSAIKCFEKVYKKKETFPKNLQILTDFTYAYLFDSPFEQIKYLNQLIEIDDQSPLLLIQLCLMYRITKQYDKSILAGEKALEIYNKWGIKPGWEGVYINLGDAYHVSGRYKEEKRLYKLAEQHFPDYLSIISRQTILALTEGDSIIANQYLDKYLSVRRNVTNPPTAAALANAVGDIYSKANILDKAEVYFRKALALQPNSDRMYVLAYFLIDKDRNVSEGLNLADTLMKLNPENYNYLHTKGWGLYKQGKYQEALKLLQKSWDLRKEKAIYNYEAFLHLEEAKKAVAGQN